MENEMMVNEEVVETATEATEEIVKKSSGKGFRIAAGVGLAIVVGGLAVKYVIIPTANKIKAKKQQNSTPIDVEAEVVDQRTPVLTVQFIRNMEQISDIEVKYFPYDEQSMSVSVNGEENFLVDKKQVQTLLDNIDKWF